MNHPDFPVSSHAYLDTAAEGIPPLLVNDALAEYAREKGSGSPGRRRHYAVQAECEAACAELLGAQADDVVLLGNASDGLNLFALAVDWRPGDEVLLSDLEFPSNVIVWLRLRERGVKVVIVPTVGGATRLDDWTDRITPRTRVVSVSQVSYKSGTQIPFLRELADAAHAVGALFVVDATQALGRVPVTVEGVDFLVASSYKWLLATHGLGVVYMAPALRAALPEPTAGWYSVEKLFTPDRFERYTPKASAGRLQAGMPNFPALYAMNASVRYLLGKNVAAIDAGLRPLMARLREGIASCGFVPLTPEDPAFASGIVSFAAEEGEAVSAALAEQGVITWGGDGRVRASVHLYNTAEDIERLIQALGSLKPTTSNE